MQSRKGKRPFRAVDKFLVIGAFFALIFSVSSFLAPTVKRWFGEKAPVQAEEAAKKKAELKKLAEFKAVTTETSYLGQVEAESETNVVAATGGTVTELNYDLGDEVSIGDKLLQIEEVRSGSAYGGGVSSTPIQQAELGLQQAKQATESAERAYKNLKKSTESDLKYLKLSKKQAEADGDADKAALLELQIKSLEKNLNSQLKAGKTQKEVAQLQEKSASLALKSLFESASPVATLDGVVTARKIDEGEYVSPGQILMTVADRSSLKVIFYISEEELDFVYEGMKILIVSNQERNFEAEIGAISPSADGASRRFLIEAKTVNSLADLTPGTLVKVRVPKKETVQDKNIFLIPLSVITVDQNENYVFAAEGGRAKKVPVEIEAIEGERARVKVELPGESEIVVEGNKFLNEGDELER